MAQKCRVDIHRLSSEYGVRPAVSLADFTVTLTQTDQYGDVFFVFTVNVDVAESIDADLLGGELFEKAENILCVLDKTKEAAFDL